MLSKVKLAYPITTNAYDDDILGLIEACKTDLKLCGVEKIDEADGLTQRAIIFYCKAFFRNNDSSERYRKAYEALKVAMSLAGDYKNDE